MLCTCTLNGASVTTHRTVASDFDSSIMNISYTAEILWIGTTLMVADDVSQLTASEWSAAAHAWAGNRQCVLRGSVSVIFCHRMSAVSSASRPREDRKDRCRDTKRAREDNR